jgi:large conductance mechanosensitive channel
LIEQFLIHRLYRFEGYEYNLKRIYIKYFEFMMGVVNMSFFEEFKKFAMRGNVIDLAVGVVIGGAFGKITSSLVDNIIMPPLSLLFGKVDFSGLFISLNGQHYDTLKAAQDAHAPILAYGLFINTIVNFLIIAFAIFVLIKQINRLTPSPAPAPEPRLCPFCKTAIADDATRCPHCTSQL